MELFLTFIKYLLLFLSAFSPVAQQSMYADTAYEASYILMGIPLSNQYPDGSTARTAWDVEIYDNKLFVAGGDYDKNAGPVPIFHYDFTQNQWINGGTIPDEQAGQFDIINGKLTIPGYDPREDWDWGNIYQYENGQWVTYRNIPNGIHQFDITEFEGKIFVGLGVLPGDSPIAVSHDNGETYQRVSMFKDGKPLDTGISDDTAADSVQIRVYDFFLLDNNLYALYSKYINRKMTLEIYQYQDGAFYYHSDFPKQLSYHRISFDLFQAKCEFNGTMYFSTGKLYRTEDMNEAEEIVLEEDANICDLRVINNQLYVVSATQTEDGQYINAVWCRSNFSKDTFYQKFFFTFDSPVQSFTYQDGYFYFGMGEGILSEANPTNGSVLAVQYSLE